MSHYPSPLPLLLILTLALFPYSPHAVEPIFTNPSNSAADFTTTYYNGDTISVTWNADSTWNLGPADLWVTWDIRNQNNFTKILCTNIDLSLSGSYDWLIVIPTSELAFDPRYVLRFKPHTSPPNYTAVISSLGDYGPGILILENTNTSTATSISTTTTVAASTTTKTTTVWISPPTSSAQQSSLGTSSSLSFGSKIGIGLGIGLPVLIVIALAYSYIRQRLRPKKEVPRDSGAQRAGIKGSKMDRSIFLRPLQAISGESKGATEPNERTGKNATGSESVDIYRQQTYDAPTLSLRQELEEARARSDTSRLGSNSQIVSMNYRVSAETREDGQMSPGSFVCPTVEEQPHQSSYWDDTAKVWRRPV